MVGFREWWEQQIKILLGDDWGVDVKNYGEWVPDLAKEAYLAATERAAGIARKFKYPKGYRQEDYVRAVDNVCDRIEKEIRGEGR